MEEITASRRARDVFFDVWAAIGVLILLTAAGWLFGRIGPALTPFMLALILVVLLRGPVAMLSERGVPRGLAVAVCYLGAVLVLALALWFIVPALVEQVGDFVTALPTHIDRAYHLWLQVTEPQGRQVVPEWVTTAVLNFRDTAVASLADWSSRGISFALSAGSGVVNSVINVLFALIIGFYMLMDLPKISAEAVSIVPERFRDEASAVTSTVARVLGGWLRGALIDSAAVGALIAIGLSLLGVPYAVPIGLIGGVLNIVPYLGPVVAAALAALAGVFVDPMLAVWAALVVIGVQQIEGFFLNPRIMAKNVDLHPVLVIFSLLAGAVLFGLAGMLLAVPVAAIAKGLFVYFFERRTRRSLCTEDGVLFRSQKPDKDDDAAGDPGRDDDDDRDA